MRKLSFDQARSQYVHRFTQDHVPAWAMQRAGKGSEAWRSGKRVMKHFVK